MFCKLAVEAEWAPLEMTEKDVSWHARIRIQFMWDVEGAAENGG